MPGTAHDDTETADGAAVQPEGNGPGPVRATRLERAVALLPVLLLAALGLAGALIAWRVSVAGNAAADADRAGLAAARSLSQRIVEADALVARTTEAWLDYERSRRRADALEEAGFLVDALRHRREATTHWFLVRPEYLGPDAEYDPEQHRAAIIEEAGATDDLDAAPYLATADAEYRRLRALLVAAVVMALALPLATFAELTHGRWRALSGMLAFAVFAGGSVLVALAWA